MTALLACCGGADRVSLWADWLSCCVALLACCGVAALLLCRAAREGGEKWIEQGPAGQRCRTGRRNDLLLALQWWHQGSQRGGGGGGGGVVALSDWFLVCCVAFGVLNEWSCFLMSVLKLFWLTLNDCSACN